MPYVGRDATTFSSGPHTPTKVTSPLIDAEVVDGENFKVNGGQGTDGQVLTSTGSGVAWEAIPSSGATTLIASVILGSAAAAMTVTGFSTSHDMYILYYNWIHDGSGDAVEFHVTEDDGTAYEVNLYNNVAQKDADSDPFTNNQARFHSNRSDLQAGTRANDDNGLLGSGHMIICNPKNDNCSFSAINNCAAYPNTDYVTAAYLFDDMNKDIGGLKFFLNGGGNFKTGSSLQLIAFARA